MSNTDYYDYLDYVVRNIRSGNRDKWTFWETFFQNSIVSLICFHKCVLTQN